VDQATAALLETAGWPEPPTRSPPFGTVVQITRNDFDLPSRG
jgi:hypothetical protein